MTNPKPKNLNQYIDKLADKYYSWGKHDEKEFRRDLRLFAEVTADAMEVEEKAPEMVDSTQELPFEMQAGGVTMKKMKYVLYEQAVKDQQQKREEFGL